MLKNTYLVKPYNVGKENRSLAIVIPSSVVKHLSLNSDSFIRLKVDEKQSELNLRIINEEELK